MARSTSGITISITCSTISTVTPVSRMFRTSSTPRFASDGVSPVITSSSSRTFGAVAGWRGRRGGGWAFEENRGVGRGAGEPRGGVPNWREGGHGGPTGRAPPPGGGGGGGGGEQT